MALRDASTMFVTTVPGDNLPPVREILSSYSPAPGVFDELRDASGAVRPHWQPLVEALARMTASERRAVQDDARRILRDNGVTFVAQGDSESTSRPWRLDALPMPIEPHEWQRIEAGVVQRARLLDAILADLYGAQRVLRSGVLPPAVVFGNPRFLRPCMNVPVRNGRFLHFLAFDIARGPDGAWWVLSDRTETPSGAGYALENRVVLSQSLTALFASGNVRRLASFFRASSEHFMSLAGSDAPSAVFLSRGPSKRTYFEHAYLARYLGYTIAEGSDLAVRDDRVYLKAVEGLKPVDLIMRSVRGEMCDPLELRSDSLIGVPSLLQALRAGHVLVGNALGSGLVESDAFLAFLPSLAGYYLGEELSLPSIATWWCGQPRERDHVLANLDDLTVRRISATRSALFSDSAGGVQNVSGAPGRDELRREILARGYDFVGQERVSLAAVPVLGDDGMLRAASVVLRVYVAATADGFEVMPGALARVALESDPRAAWWSAGDAGKDVWVLSDEPVETFSLLAQRQEAMRLRRGTRELPSRAADNLFWLGRYAERAEAAVRLLRSLVIRLRGEAGSARHAVSPERVVGLLVLQKHLSVRRGRRAMQQGREAVEHELWTILFDPECRDGLANVLDNVRRTADAVRDRLSFDAYRIVKDLGDAAGASQDGPRQTTDEALRLLNRLIQFLAAFNGLVMENMTRGYGWRFLDMGRRLERLRSSVELTQQLAVRGDPAEDGALELLLELADSALTYRGRYQSAPRLPAALDLLLCDDTNPRAALFQVVALADHMDQLPRRREDGPLSQDQRVTTRIASDLKLADTFALSEQSGRFETRSELDRLLRRIEQSAGELSDYITRQFFSHSAATRISGDERGTP